jgi:curved DNA-binding protein CbpA
MDSSEPTPDDSPYVCDFAEGLDFYERLGVPKDANERAIKKAFRKLSLTYHPDKVKGKTEEKECSQSHFIAITKAYETLSDEEKRRKVAMRQRVRAGGRARTHTCSARTHTHKYSARTHTHTHTHSHMRSTTRPHACTHAHTHTHTHTRTHTHLTHARTHARTHAQTHTHTHGCTQTRTHTNTHTHTNTNTRAHTQYDLFGDIEDQQGGSGGGGADAFDIFQQFFSRGGAGGGQGGGIHFEFQPFGGFAGVVARINFFLRRKTPLKSTSASVSTCVSSSTARRGI